MNYLIILCCKSSFNWSTFWTATGAIATTGTLIILIIGYYKFLQNKLRDKQLKTVVELIKEIQQEGLQFIHFKNFSNNLPFPFIRATLFDIVEMNKFDEDAELYFCQEEGKILDWDFFYKFSSHPLLPISIARQLKKFNFYQLCQSKSSEQVTGKHIVIGRINLNHGHIPTYMHFTEGEMMTCKGFKDAAKGLRDAIKEWADIYNLDDLNITTSHYHQMYNKQNNI